MLFSGALQASVGESDIVITKKAAEQGDVSAQNSLGDMYYLSTGVLQDYKQAFTWYRQAAEQGHAGAQNNLGVIYARGKGVPPERRQASIYHLVSWAI